MSIPSVEDLKKVTLERVTATPAESDVNAAIEQLAAAHPQLKPVLLIRPTRKGDVAIIDFVGSIDGVEFPGGSGTDYPLELGSGSFIPGFEEQLVDRNVGDVVNVRVPFPEDYHAKELAGKMAVFRTTIKSLKQKKEAVIDDEFAKQFGMPSITAMRQKVAEGLQESMNDASFQKLRFQAMEKLVDLFPVDAPANIVEQEMEIIQKHEPEIPAEEARMIATRRAMQGILLMELAKANNVTISDEEVMEALKNEVQQYGPQAPQILAFYQKNPQMIAMFRAGEMEKKVLRWVIDQCSVTEKKVSREEFEKAMEI
ncbi:MAG: trigger factor [Thermoguttaceae bacterium]|nr:trigger factor [Thermoguttaceae bacterium]